MWEGVCDKEVLDFYDNNCKFMCAQSDADRADWVASIIQAQQDVSLSGIHGGCNGILSILPPLIHALSPAGGPRRDLR